MILHMPKQNFKSWDYSLQDMYVPEIEGITNTVMMQELFLEDGLVAYERK